MYAAKKKAHDDGLLYEGMAELYLRAKGYKILKKRYKTGLGEIDIIALDADVLVFAEVKGRASVEDALFSITPRMKLRIEGAANHFISEYPEYCQGGMRFDVIAISLPFSIRHIDNAWQVTA